MVLKYHKPNMNEMYSFCSVCGWFNRMNLFLDHFYEMHDANYMTFPLLEDNVMYLKVGEIPMYFSKFVFKPGFGGR